MPGINLLATSGALPRHIAPVFSRLQQALLHFESYTQQTVVAAEKAIIGLTAYPRYPRMVVEMDHATAVLDGLIYNRNTASLRALLDKVVSRPRREYSASERDIASFVSDADGEFVVVVYDRQHKRLVVFNDVLGRLPFYHARERGLFVASREVKFIVPLLQSLNFNREALMQYLLYGFPFADATLVEGVRQLAPSAIMVFDCQDNSFSETTSPQNHRESNVRMSRPDAVRAMKHYFTDGLSRRLQRFGDHTAVVSLSGGLDSRATLAGISALHRDVQAITLDTPEKSLASDCAEAFRTPIHVAPKTHDAGTLLPEHGVFLSDGLDSHPEQESIHKFLDHTARTYGEHLVYYTGYFGGELTRYAHIKSGLRSLDSLVRYLLWANDAYKYNTHRVTLLLGIDYRTVYASLSRHLSSFPDPSPYKRYLNFRYEYDRYVIGHGEDRSRFHFRTATPFSSLELFRFITSLDGSLKDTSLFRDFLFALDSRTCAVKYYNYGLSLKSGASMRLLRMIEGVAKVRAFKTIIRPLWRCYDALHSSQDIFTMTWRKHVLELLDATEDARDYFCVPQCREVIHREKNLEGLARMCILLRHMKYMRACRAQTREGRKLLHGADRSREEAA